MNQKKERNIAVSSKAENQSPKCQPFYSIQTAL
jgi:hypothetical protein